MNGIGITVCTRDNCQLVNSDFQECRKLQIPHIVLYCEGQAASCTWDLFSASSDIDQMVLNPTNRQVMFRSIQQLVKQIGNLNTTFIGGGFAGEVRNLEIGLALQTAYAINEYLSDMVFDAMEVISTIYGSRQITLKEIENVSK